MIGYEVICQDGERRHEAPFLTRREADVFAWWGHACTAKHTIRPTHTHEEKPIMSKQTFTITLDVHEGEPFTCQDVVQAFTHHAFANLYRDGVYSIDVREAVGLDVRDFVSAEDDPLDGLGQVIVWSADGVGRQVIRETRATCSIAAQIIADALRTWEGWK